MQNTEPRERIIRYLLGELLAEEARLYEETYFLDDRSFAALLVMEQELIERYVRDELSARQRRRFENYFLGSAARRQRVQTARRLTRPATKWKYGWQKVRRFFFQPPTD